MRRISLVIVLICQATFGCTVSVSYYFVNHTQKSCSILLGTPEDITGRDFIFASSANVAQRLQFYSFRKFEKPLTGASNGNQVICDVPPMTVVYLGPGSNFDPYFERMLIIQGNRTDTVFFDNSKKIKTRRDIFSYVAWFDYY